MHVRVSSCWLQTRCCWWWARTVSTNYITCNVTYDEDVCTVCCHLCTLEKSLYQMIFQLKYNNSLLHLHTTCMLNVSIETISCYLIFNFVKLTDTRCKIFTLKCQMQQTPLGSQSTGELTPSRPRGRRGWGGR